MLVKENIARDLLRLMVWYPIRYLVFILPVRYGYAIFRCMGDIHYFISRGKKRLIRKNLQLALGRRLNDKKISKTVRYYFRNHYVNQLQIFLFPKFNNRNIERFHTFEGLENLKDALKKKKGCILIHPHFGPVQLPLCALGIMGFPMMQVGLLTDEGLSYIGRKVAFRLRTRYESNIPARIVSATSFLRPVMNWIRDNRVLMMTGDGAGGGRFIGKFIPVEFLGRATMFPAGVASLAVKAGVPLLPLFTVEDNKTYKTIIHKPIAIEYNPREEAISAIVMKFVRIMEDYCYKFPYLWHFWDEWEERTLPNVNAPVLQDYK